MSAALALRLARRGLSPAVGVLALSGCLVVPVTRDVYDPDCRLMRREVTLEAAVVGQFHSCGGQECTALLVTLGVVSAASLVVSGSLAVVGNVVYWIEHEKNCRRGGGASPPGATPPQVPAPIAPTPMVPTSIAPAPPGARITPSG